MVLGAAARRTAARVPADRGGACARRSTPLPVRERSAAGPVGRPMRCPPTVDKHTHTHTHTHNRLTAFVRDNPGRPVPQETLTHSHPTGSSDILYHLPPFTAIHGILFVHFFACLTVLSYNLSPGPLWSSSWSWTLNFILRTFFTQSSSSFRSTCPYQRSLFCCKTNAMSSITSLSLQSIHTRAQTPSPRSVSAPAPICFAVVYILVIFVRPIISTSTYCLNIIYDMSHVASIDGFMPSLSTCQCTCLLLMLLFCYVTNSSSPSSSSSSTRPIFTKFAGLLVLWRQIMM